MDDFGIGVVTQLGLDRAIAATRLALRAHGFGIISEMPTGDRSHLFMSIFQRVVSTGNLGGEGLDVGDHLQCHVVVYEEGADTVVACLDPTIGFAGLPDLGDVAADARQALEDAFTKVAQE
ncbi:MAG: hypothetical protein ABIS18_04090 [Actinomycetota bacterium]